MKKIFNIISLGVVFTILAGCIAACSNDTNDNLSEQMSKTQLSETELLLSDYNNSLPSTSETRSATTEEWIVIAAKDAKGAYKGGKTGGRLGKFFWSEWSYCRYNSWCCGRWRVSIIHTI